MFLFGGNSIGPSITSSMDKGAHIIDILNYIKPDAYGVADSDFIFSKDDFSLIANEAVSPFVLSNASNIDNSTIYGTVKNIIITKQGFKIGILQALGKTSKSRYCINDIVVDDVMPEIQKNAKKLR
ncbi:hypothetical protein [Campylobacter pinnipediorum]|uniref:hypothetical protein n=2 Tax=Campylobacter pinnipediorum TaxID=1965231 RepID=UPI000995DEA2|nr:hypothetical protein [Campylobacter pinnipediorum]